MYVQDGDSKKLKSEVWYEFYLDHPEMSYQEIAEHFGVTKNTLNSALYFVRKKRGTVIPRGNKRH